MTRLTEKMRDTLYVLAKGLPPDCGERTLHALQGHGLVDEQGMLTAAGRVRAARKTWTYPTPEQVQHMCDLYRRGYSAAKIAAKIGYSRSCVCRNLRMSGVRPKIGRQIECTDELFAEVLRYRSFGAPWTFIAKKIGLSRSTLERARDRHKVD